MSKCRILGVCVGLMFALMVIGLAPAKLMAAPPPQMGGATGPGCASDRAVATHHAGGEQVQAPSGMQAPVPCSVSLDMRVGELSLVVSKAGTVVLRPIWKGDTNGPPNGTELFTAGSANPTFATTPAYDTNLWADPQTGRLFWMSCGGRCAHPLFEISDDDGKTWYPGPRPLTGPGPYGVGTGGYDHVQVFGGPPVASMKGLLKGGYPNVVYACLGHDPLKCEKSQDGGLTWGPELVIPFPPTAQMKSIQAAGGGICSAFGLQGMVESDGTVIVPYEPCNRPYVAVSHDEGAHWTLVQVTNEEEIGYGYPSLGMDSAGNLYAAWVQSSDRMLYMAISRDKGMHWSAPMMIAAPGVNEAAIPFLVAGKDGQVAVSYYGSKNAPHPFPAYCNPLPAGRRGMGGFTPPPPGPTQTCPGYENETWDTYVTETWDATDAQPVFWSTTLNDPSRPSWYGITPSELGVVRWDENFSVGASFFRGGSPRLDIDYYGSAMGPDGTVWVGYAQMCPYGQTLGSAGNPNCPSGNGPTDGGFFTILGRLVPQGGSQRSMVMGRRAETK